MCTFKVAIVVFISINIKDKGVEKMTIRHSGPVVLLSMLMALILFSNMQGLIRPSYAAEQEAGVRTLSIKVGLDKSVLNRVRNRRSVSN